MKEQQEESCQLQTVRNYTQRWAENFPMVCGDHSSSRPWKWGYLLRSVPQNALRPCWLRRQRDSNGLQSGSSASFHQTDSPIVLSLPVFAANHFMPWHRVPELSRYTSSTKILRLNCRFHSVPFFTLHVVHSPVETLQIFGWMNKWITESGVGKDLRSSPEAPKCDSKLESSEEQFQNCRANHQKVFKY